MELEKKPKNETRGQNIFMTVLCYGVACLFVCLIVYILSGVIVDMLTPLDQIKWLHGEITRVNLIGGMGILVFLWRMTANLGNHWRSSSKNEIGTSVTNFPNPFYDPNFVEGPLRLQTKYAALLRKTQRTDKKIKFLLRTLREYKEHINLLEREYDVVLRHHDNVNRIIRSLNYVYKCKDKGMTTRMIRYILDECITVLKKDNSDKSVTLFAIQDEMLCIKESVRINAESASKRVFKKGEGFAGYIWDRGKPEIVNEILEGDERFRDGGLPATAIGSILGFPLEVDGNIIGVLCLQAESQQGFSTSDLKAVEFYVRMCTFMLIYDKL